MNAVTEMEALANASIEEIEAMSLKGEAQVQLDDAAESQDANSGEQDVAVVVSSDPAEQQAESEHKPNDKEINFAKLRTKAESLERDVQRLADENKRLAERQYVAELPEGHAQRVAEMDAKLADIGGKFQSGAIDWQEYQSQLLQANAEREGLLAASIKVQISSEMREQAERETAERAASTCEQAVSQFIAAKPDSLDYATDEAKQRDLNTYVKALAADADNSDKPMDWFLQEAHALVKAKHRIAAPAPAVVDSQPAPSQKVPFHTLSEVPGGSLPAVSEGSKLSQMGGAALTELFLKDPSKIDDYLASL